MFETLRALLPKGRAWRVVVDKQLRHFFEALGHVLGDARQAFDKVFWDAFPGATGALEEWEDQFALPNTGLTDQQRRDRLDAAWKAQGGQSPRYIQDTLQGAGFGVYVHEWWVPGTETGEVITATCGNPDMTCGAPEATAGAATISNVCATPRNPLLYLKDPTTGLRSEVDAGEPLAEAGEPTALAGQGPDPVGYPLVNKLTKTVIAQVDAGEVLAEAGEELAEAGNTFGFSQVDIDYPIPTDPQKWVNFVYIGGEIFGQTATVAPSRRDEFETLCLKICPSHLWIGVLVEYS